MKGDNVFAKNLLNFSEENWVFIPLSNSQLANIGSQDVPPPTFPGRPLKILFDRPVDVSMSWVWLGTSPGRSKDVT